MQKFRTRSDDFQTLYNNNAAAVDGFNLERLYSLLIMGGLVLILPMMTAPLSQTRSQLVETYALISIFMFFTYFLFRLSFMKPYVKLALYVGFSIFIAFTIYLSLIHTPDMRATILLVVFSIFPSSFIDKPTRMNLFLIFWFVVHGLLAFHCKPALAIDDIINTLGSMIAGILIGNKMVWGRLESFNAYRLTAIERETDILTGLHNRHKLFETIVKLESDEYLEFPTAVIMIDIDHFKLFNDTFGHAMGDNYLNKVGIMLQDFSAKYELEIYRYGGEEFLVLAYRYSQEELMDIAEEIRLAFHEIRIASQHTSASLGVTHCHRNETKNLDSMIKLADQAVYIAKNAGRDKVAYLPVQIEERG